MSAVDLVLTDATEQARLVQSGRVTARSLVTATLRRIDELDSSINAYRVVMAESALASADRIDALPRNDRERLPLAGVPVAIKDDTDVAGETTAWGSAADRGVRQVDAEVVARLRRAGAIIIGKTNVPELTLWPWTASKRWGVTRNPWALDRTPGGSSGGSAAAVCTGMAALALGSDGGGSVRYPAALTGLVGVKPQRERVPMGPEHGTGWHGLVVLGPLARSVRDAALFLDVVGGDVTTSILRDAVSSERRLLRVGVSINPPPGTHVTLSAASLAAVTRARALLADRGHELVDVTIDYGFTSLWSSTVRLLRGARDDAASLPRRGLERRTRNVARLGALVPAQALARAVRRESIVAASVNAVFDRVDVVLTPLCASPAPLIDRCPARGALRSLRRANTSAWLVPWNTIGQPAVSVPVGHAEDGLPAAVHLAGRPGDEGTLLALAGEIEAHSPDAQWSHPTCAPTSSSATVA